MGTIFGSIAEKTGTERLSKLPKVTQPSRGADGIPPPAVQHHTGL